jgi:hypothetical protein
MYAQGLGGKHVSGGVRKKRDRSIETGPGLIALHCMIAVAFT